MDMVWPEEVFVHGLIGREERIHGSVRLSVGKVFLGLLGGEFDGMKITKGVITRDSSWNGLILQRIVVVVVSWSPEVGNEFFEIFRVFVSNLFEEESILIGIEKAHAILRDTIHIITQTVAVHVDAAIKYAG